MPSLPRALGTPQALEGNLQPFGQLSNFLNGLPVSVDRWWVGSNSSKQTTKTSRRSCEAKDGALYSCLDRCRGRRVKKPVKHALAMMLVEMMKLVNAVEPKFKDKGRKKPYRPRGVQSSITHFDASLCKLYNWSRGGTPVAVACVG
jgi:hypothetical protein